MVDDHEMRRKFLSKFVEFEKFITDYISASKKDRDIYMRREDVKSIRNFARVYLCKSVLTIEYHNWCDEESGIKNIPGYSSKMLFGDKIDLVILYYIKTYKATTDDKSIDIINKNKKLNVIKIAFTNCIKYRRDFFYNNCSEIKIIAVTPTLTHKHTINKYEEVLNPVSKEEVLKAIESKLKSK